MIDPTDEAESHATRHRSNGHHPDARTLPSNGWLDDGPPPPPSGAVLHPPAPPAQRRWFLAQLWSEFRLAVRMYFDPRYRVSRTAQLLVPVLLAAFVLNYFAFGVWFAIPLLSPILERLVCVLLGVFLYKVMTRELARYHEVLDYLARYGPR